jgi:hypothetical protein
VPQHMRDAYFSNDAAINPGESNAPADHPKPSGQQLVARGASCASDRRHAEDAREMAALSKAHPLAGPPIPGAAARRSAASRGLVKPGQPVSDFERVQRRKSGSSSAEEWAALQAPVGSQDGRKY